MGSYIVLCLEDMRVALALSCIERTARAVEVIRLPSAPEIVLGVVNAGGRVIPVVNMRRRFCLPEREIKLTDRLIIAHTRQRTVALVADAVSGVFEYAEPEISDAGTILPGLEYIDGIVEFGDGLILIHNLDRFLSLEEAESLDRAMAASEGA